MSVHSSACYQLGPPIPVYRYTEYRDTATNVGGIDTGIVLSNTVIFGIGNSVSQRCLLSSLWRFVGLYMLPVASTSRLPCSM